MGKKDLLANLLFGHLKCISLPLFDIIKPTFFYVLGYHRVFPDPGTSYPFEKGTISATPDEFENQLLFIKSRFNVINFDMLSNILSKGVSVPKKSLIITFDDGYADNYELAFKILKKYNLTATIFLSTSFLDSGELFWFDKLTYMIKKMPHRSISEICEKILKFTPPPAINKEEVRESIAEVLSTVTNEERLDFLFQLEKESKIEASKEDSELAKPLNWVQIKKMSDQGIEIGSHTMSHPFLTKLPTEEIIIELAESKKVIEKKIGKRVKSIAYPGGDYNQTVIDCARNVGYEFGISYEHDIHKISKYEKFAIPRIHVELDVSYHLFQANLLFPQLFVKYGVRQQFLKDRGNLK